MNIRRNILLFKLNCLFGDMFPLAVLAVVYFQQVSGSYATAMAVFALMNVVQSVSEIPTGILSDRIGRRRTLILAAIMTFLGVLCFALGGNIVGVPLLFIGGAILGVADAIASGTDDAFMYETMQELGHADTYDILFARSKAFGQIGLTIGAAIAAVVTYFWSLNILAWVSVMIAGIHFVVTLFFIEPRNTGATNRTSWRIFVAACRDFFKNSKLQMLGLLKITQQALGYTGHRIEGAYFNMLIPMWMVNVARGLKQLCGTISFFVAPYFRKYGFYKMLIGSTLATYVIKIVSLILNNTVTPFLQSSVNLFYGASATASSALVQRELSPTQRATMGSIISLVGGIISGLVGICVGILADMYSMYVAIIVITALYFVVPLGYYLLNKKYK